MQLDSHVALPLPAIEIVLKRLDEPGLRRATCVDRGSLPGHRRMPRERPRRAGRAGRRRARADRSPAASGRPGLWFHVTKHLGQAVVHLARDSLPLLGDRQRSTWRWRRAFSMAKAASVAKTRQRLLVIGIEGGVCLLLGEVEVAQHAAVRDDRQGE